MSAQHLFIAGRVQGVGYRDWLVREATGRGIDGWVRNRRDGRVEALVAGAPEVVAGLLDACRAGPPAARVAGIVATPAEPPAARGFQRVATV